MELGFGLSKLLIFPLYLSCILAIILTIFYRIEIGIFFLIFFILNQNILNYVNIYPLGKDMNDLLIIAIIIKWIIDKQRAGERLLVKTPLNFPIFIFLVWTVIEVWWGMQYFNDQTALNFANPRIIFWKNLIRIPLLYLIIVNNIKDISTIRIIVFVMIMAILLLDRGFYNIAQYSDFSHYSSSQRVGAIASLGPNELAVCLAMYSVVIVSLFIFIRNIWIKLFLLGPICLSYYCIAFLFSRSGYMAAITGLITLGFLKDKKILLLLVLLFFVWQSVLPVAVRERVEMTRSEDGYDDTSQQRLSMWEMGIDIVSSSPILGAGIAASRFINITIEEDSNKIWHSFHNAYIEQAVETGIVGLGVYLLIFLLMITSGWRLYKTTDDNFQKALGLGLIACVLSCMAGNITGSNWNYFAVVGYMFALAGLVTRCTMNSEYIHNIEQVNENILEGEQNSSYAF